MATYQADLAALQIPAANEVWTRGRGREATSDLFLARATYLQTSNEADNDIIELCKMPKGVALVPGLSQIICADPGTTLTLDVGDDGGDAAPSGSAAWADATAYVGGNIVTNGARVYECILAHTSDNTASTGDEPGLHNVWKTYWKEVGLLDDDDRYASAVVVSAGGIFQMDETNADIFPAWTDSDTIYYATYEAPNTLTANVFITFNLVFRTQS